MLSDPRVARVLLNALPNIGPVTYRRLTAAFGSAPDAPFRASRQQLLAVKGIGPEIAETILNWERRFDLRDELEKIQQHNYRFVIPDDGAAYPPLLSEISDPPIGLYAAGEFRWGERCVAIVGSRRLTAYGKQTARTFARELAASGWCIVSGLARGADTEAHKGALEVGGATVAVLGNGVDIIYPTENAALYQQIAERGVVFSEFTLGRRADRQTFPMRNRIVSGISRAVIVIESDTDGGSMITARFAGEQGRDICAVPGRIDSPQSRGCHALIRDGATLVTSVDDVLNAISELRLDFKNTAGNTAAGTAGSPAGSSAPTPSPNLPLLGPNETAILNQLSGGTALGADALAERTGIPADELMSTLLMMELDRLLRRNDGGTYEPFA